MPWKVFKEGGKFCLHKMNPDGSKGATVHCHESAEMARRQQAALYVSEKKELSPEDNIIIDEDGSELKEFYDPIQPAYLSTAHSFEQLESEREARDRMHELEELMSDFQSITGNIIYTPPELLESDKITELDRLYSEFKSRASELIKEEPKKKSFLEKASEFVKEKLGLTPPVPPVMVWKELDGSYSWITSYSNKFIDRDNPPDIIASTAHKEFVERVDKGEAALPDLFLWHVPEWKIGYATALAYDDSGFPIAIGRFDDNKESKEVAEWLSKQTDFGVSHGMWNRTIRRDPEDESVIIAYETHEISPLPKERAANLLADWYVIETKELEEVNMTIPEEKRQELLKRGLPEQTLSALEERNKKVAETASAEGIKSKETEETQPVPEQTADSTESEVPVTEPVKEEDSKESDFPTRQEVAEAVASVVAPVVEDLKQKYEELSQKYGDVMKALNDFQASDEKRIKEIISMTPRDSLASLMASRFDRASSSKQTKVGEGDSLLKNKPREEEVKEESRVGIKFIDNFLKDGK